MCGHFGWTEWGEWSQCSVSCDRGTSVRNRICVHQLDASKNETCVGARNDTKNCSIEPCAVNGQWSDWSAWGNCSVTCENGTRTRHRECTDPGPQFGGMNCTGDTLEIEECSSQPCPVHGGWCTKQGYTTTCTRNYRGEYSLSNSFSMMRSTCSCPTPRYGGEQCKQ
ncbi:thrombospondin-2-like isoform X1 [Ruditapes philippinarum]|uniref:thrombospondin-2-like isoform X1 n=1 Tax=Ruditapes philippinarum TaxID=129788 RepID=UPI00295AC13A|nr:thrombospondin-2-like isoform X1 [Ruditapes philippinarum]